MAWRKKKLARLNVKVLDSYSRTPLPYVYVEIDGRVLNTGLDGVATFDLPAGLSYTIKVRQVAYRPWTRTIQITTEEGTYEQPVELEKAIY